jgi:alpha-tubulin suppressor-like RCC1 family protein
MIERILRRTRYRGAIPALLCLVQAVFAPILGAAPAYAPAPLGRAEAPQPGDAWAWGYNQWGQLGIGPSSDRNLPVQLLAPSGVNALSGGYYHTLALHSSGQVYAWGRNADGQLGLGSSDNEAHPYATPTPGLDAIVAIAAGAFHNLALAADGAVWAWGYNHTGQLGDGTTATRTSPVQVLAAGSGVVAIAAGYGHSLALREDGTVLSWGYNAEGQLGDGTTSQREIPLPIPGLTGVSAIAAGWFHSLALKDDGATWAWGMGIYGQLGSGTQANASVPLAVAGLAGVSGISAGHFHSLAVKEDGTLWAWGNNNQGQLGDGTVGDGTPNIRTLPYKVAGFTAGVAVTAAAGGWGHTLALLDDGTAWSWGLNLAGQLGTGPAVAQAAALSVPEVERRTLGDEATWGDAFALRADAHGSAAPSAIYRATPAPITALSGVALAAAGYYHSLAMIPNPRPAWDVNGDHIADIADVSLVGLHWLQSGPPGWIPEDVNGDGFIDVADIAVIGAHWLQTW